MSARSGSESRYRDTQVAVRLTAAEKADLCRNAEALGVTVGQYVRRRLLTDAGWSLVRLPERRIERAVGPGGYVAVIEEAVGWNRCLDAIERLSGGPA